MTTTLTQKFCFTWFLNGSTIIEAKTLAEALAKWDTKETNIRNIIGSAGSSTDCFSTDECFVESESGSGIFDTEVEI